MTDNDLFLSEQEKTELTGYRAPGKQAGWLRMQGVPHYRRADGKVVVLRRDLQVQTQSPGQSVSPRLGGLSKQSRS